MMSAARKRLRGGSLANSTTGECADADTARALRASLALRINEKALPPQWVKSSNTATTGVDTFLCNLGGSIASALRALHESAEVSHVQLLSLRAMLHAAIDARCDNLEAALSKAEASKATALERELVAVDVALERWRAESRAIRETMSVLSDVELMTEESALSSRLDDLEAQLRALPTAVVEPRTWG